MLIDELSMTNLQGEYSDYVLCLCSPQISTQLCVCVDLTLTLCELIPKLYAARPSMKTVVVVSSTTAVLDPTIGVTKYQLNWNNAGTERVDELARDASSSD